MKGQPNAPRQIRRCKIATHILIDSPRSISDLDLDVFASEEIIGQEDLRRARFFASRLQRDCRCVTIGEDKFPVVSVPVS